MTIPPPPDSPQNPSAQTPPAWNDAPADPAAGYAPPAPNSGAPYGGAPYASAPVSPPGRVLSIIGLVLAFVAAPVGLILSIVAAVKLGKAGAPKGLAIAGIIVGAVFTLLWIIGIILFVTVIGGVIGTCAELGPGVWDVNGVTYTCG
ncbi:DUF4190 domain-containing protein [Microbacterium sp. K24]|uniref:DUF4190 domain-containing protein n=1 Tax=Microbacterium sp. K24 TaxID=2305446 RepID=UPI00109D4F17|nr:DUF4190 domain-containing protein [Microbacterium sp. K24]